MSGFPTAALAVPRAVTELAHGRHAEPVWVNGIGGTTWRLGGADPTVEGVEFVKLLPHEHAHELLAETARLAWAGAYVPVPEVIDHGEVDDGAWLRTRALPGWSAIDPRWQDEPRTAAIAVGESLRALHEALPVGDCPFEWSTGERLARSGADEAAVAALGPEPSGSRTVVCHGDACTPNTLIGADGRWVGHVDLGSLGIADRWADIAVATMAFGWNHGPGWDGVLLDAYGIAFDEERSDWYRALWSIGD
jgi:kanamycin kinase